MNKSEWKSQLLRQQTCPALVTGKTSIPFCIPAHTKSYRSSEDERNEIKGINKAESLGSVNQDLYLIDQYENIQEQDGAPEGNFSSLSEARFPPGHVGRVWFALHYEEKSEKLMLSLLKARNLRRPEPQEPKLDITSVCLFPLASMFDDSRKRPSSVKLKRKLFALGRRPLSEGKRESIAIQPHGAVRSMENTEIARIVEHTTPPQLRNLAGSSREMFSVVKIYLLPDERMLGQAKCKRRDVDPIFVDRFVFQISAAELRTRSLRMVFVEIDGTRKHHVIGHVTYPLWNAMVNGRIVFQDIERGEPEDTPDNSAGEIQLSLCYDNDLSRLTVVLLRTKMSFPSQGEQNIETTIDLNFNVCGKPQKIKHCRVSQRRSVIADNSKTEVSGEFPLNESFRFNLSADDVDRACLKLDVKCRSKDTRIHRSVALGGPMFARGKAAEQWLEMQNNQKEFVKSWQHLTIQND